MYTYYPQTTATTTVVSTEGLVWNGSTWVSPVSGGTISTSPTATELVHLYTESYHAYIELVRQSQAEAEQYKAPEYATQHAECLRHVTWYQYYADQSSRAAHFYYQNPNTLTPPPFELPPPRKLQDVKNNNNSSLSIVSLGSPSSSSNSSSASLQPPTPVAEPTTTAASGATSSTANSTSNNPSSSPDGLKRFFHKCLQACSTEQQRKEVQGKLEQVIAKAIQEGTLHTMNWDGMELVSPTTLNSGADEPRALESNVAHSTNGVATVDQNKREWLEVDYSNDRVQQPSSTLSYTPKNKRTKFQAPDAQNNLGNHKNAVGRRSTPLTPFSEATRVTPPLETTSSLNYYGPSSNQYNKQLPINDSFYGPTRSTLEHNSCYAGSLSGSSEEDFVAVPNLPSRKGSGRYKVYGNQDGFERSNSKMVNRANRFGNTSSSTSVPSVIVESNFDKYMGKGTIGGSNKKLEEADFEMMTVKGTCTRLEKEYLRLTAPPRAELVRPQNILEKHFDNLVTEWTLKSSRRDYTWFCSQFKAIRQDCRVQRILNAFTVQVYETHARVALESDDLNEFNQCQTQLMELYDLLLSPSHPSIGQDAARNHRNEFLAYRFIYYVFLTGTHKGSSSSSDLMALMLSLIPDQWKDPAIAHAARIREAVASVDYHSFFRLQKNCPNLGAYLVDRMVPLIRLKALQRICKSYRPSVEVSHVLSELGFDQTKVAEGTAWLESCGCIIKGDMILTKDSVVRESNLQVKNSLI